jgi:hypothetical protein
VTGYSSKYSYNSNTSKYTEFFDRQALNFPIIVYENLINLLNETSATDTFGRGTNVGRSMILARSRASVSFGVETRIFRVFTKVNTAELESGFAKVSFSDDRGKCVEISFLYVPRIYRTMKATKEKIYRQFIVFLFETFAVAKCFIRVICSYESYIRFLMKLGFKLDKSVATTSESDKIFVLRREEFLSKNMYDIVEEGETHAQMPIVRHRG